MWCFQNAGPINKCLFPVRDVVNAVTIHEVHCVYTKIPTKCSKFEGGGGEYHLLCLGFLQMDVFSKNVSGANIALSLSFERDFLLCKPFLLSTIQ